MGANDGSGYAVSLPTGLADLVYALRPRGLFGTMDWSRIEKGLQRAVKDYETKETPTVVVQTLDEDF
jgi:hypothetical protein